MDRDFESNYDKIRENWRKKFLDMDQEALIARFHLENDENALYVDYYSHRIRIDRRNGELCYADNPEKVPTFNTAMDIYNMFYYAAPAPVASGNMEAAHIESKEIYGA